VPQVRFEYLMKGVIMTYPVSTNYPRSEVDELIAAAYNKGVSDGYGLAVTEEVLELHAMKYGEEKDGEIRDCA
jgi:hypothetical protein